MRAAVRGLSLWCVALTACHGGGGARGVQAAEGGGTAAGTTITEVRIVDGSGTPAILGAVRIIGDSIVAVGKRVTPKPGDLLVDGHGLVLAPGFIDTHSHHDWHLAAHPEALAAVSQGITTIIAGQDGSHPIPLAASVDSLARDPRAVNVAYYAGHGSIRTAVMGADFKRLATAPEVDSMARLLCRELDAGALGLSTGLEYDPGIYSDRAEVLALAKVTAAAGGRYISHIRSEDRWFWDAVDEILTVGREAKLPVQMSHVKLAMVPLIGLADSLLRVLDRARASGIDVTADIYPYPFWQSTLTVLFPRRDFDNADEARRILAEIVPANGLLIGDYAPEPSYRGKTVAEIAVLRREEPATTLMRLIRDAERWPARPAGAENGVVSSAVESVVATAMDERDIARLMQWPETNICSDGLLDGAHPRGFGAFPRVLAKYVREEHALTLEEAVHKMTALSAQHVGLRRRGVVAPGYFADLVLFDPDRVADHSTPREPHRIATGIVGVWVNGRTVWRDGRTTGAHPGRALRRQGR